MAIPVAKLRDDHLEYLRESFPLRGRELLERVHQPSLLAESHALHECEAGRGQVDRAAACVDGVVFSRGQVVPALNLRARFGFERAPYDVATRLVVVQSDGRTVGLVVDAAIDLDADSQ